MAGPKRFTPEEYQRFADNARSSKKEGSNMDKSGGCGMKVLLGCVVVGLISTTNLWFPKVSELVAVVTN